MLAENIQTMLCYIKTLSYFIETTRSNGTYGYLDGFLFNDLAGWLVMGKNAEFARYYVDNTSRIAKQNRINDRRRRIQNCINNLEEMFLVFIVERVKARRNNELTPLYRYSGNGQILAWIIKRNTTDILLDKDKMKRPSHTEKGKLIKIRATAEEKIYEIIETKFPESNRSESSGLDYEHLSKYIFKSKFFKLCKENKIFSSILDTMVDILSSNSKIKHMSDVFDRVVYQYAVFPNKRFREKVWDTFVSTLNSLDETQRRILLYREKFDIERRIESSDFLSREWEELWLQNINCCSKLVLIGSCENCRQTYPIVVDYYKYKEDGILLEDTMPVLEMDCQKCKAKGKLLISTWDKKHT